MNRDAMEKLRLDRRLTNRRGWISKAELERSLEALPDVSDKIAPREEEEAEPPNAAPSEETAFEAAAGEGAAVEAVPPRVE
jgi:hypothetical protein